MRSFVLPRALGGKIVGFEASGSISSALHERDRRKRAGLLTRLQVTLFSHYAIVHLVFVVACLVGVGLNLARAFSTTYIPNLWDEANLETSLEKLTFLVTRLGWPPLLWVQFVTSASTPLTYAIWPPAEPERESLLDRCQETLIAYPTLRSRTYQRTVWGVWRYGRATFAMLYTLVLFTANEVIER